MSTEYDSDDPIALFALAARLHEGPEYREGSGNEYWDAVRALHRRSESELLLMLMTDPKRDVRDWATFAIGTQTDSDSAEIRLCV
jgi:hypothetical protein